MKFPRQSWRCASTTPSRSRSRSSLRRATTPSACTPAAPRSTTTPTSAISAPSLSSTSCARWLRASGFRLDHVMNITDVDDKIIRNAAAAGQDPGRVHRHLHQGVSGRLRHAAAGASGAPGASHRAHRRHGGCHRAAGAPATTPTRATARFISASPRFPEYGKLSHNDFSGNLAGARVDVDEYEKADARDFALWKAPKDGEPCLGHRYRPGPAGLAHRVLRDGHQVPGRDAGYPRRRRRPDLPASRKRDCAIRIAHRQAVRALLAARRVSDGGRPEDVQVAGQLFHPARPARRAATRRRPSATCWLRCPTASR